MIRNKLILGFGVIIGILIAEIVLNQIISHKATTIYRKLKLEAIPATKILEKYDRSIKRINLH